MAYQPIPILRGDRFHLVRDGDIDIEIIGQHLGGIEKVEKGQVIRRLSVFQTRDGKYAIALSGSEYNRWAVVLEDAQALRNHLMGEEDYLGEMEKLLLEEVARRDGRIRDVSRIRVGALKITKRPFRPECPDRRS